MNPRTKDSAKSFVCYAIVVAVSYLAISLLLQWLLTDEFMADHMPPSVVDPLKVDVRKIRIHQLTGNIEFTAWIVLGAVEAIGFVWLVRAWFYDIHKPGMARSHILVYSITMLIALVAGVLLACDGYWWGSFQTGLQGQLTDDLRFILTLVVVLWSIGSAILAVAVAVPPVIRRAAFGGTGVSWVTDSLHIWEF